MLTPAATEEALGRAWLARARLDRAIAHFRRALELEPGRDFLALDLARLYLSQERLQEACEILTQALEHQPNQHELHKLLSTVLLRWQGWEAALRHYRLRRLSPERCWGPGVVVVSVLYNERPRLEFFLNYYRRLGVAGFLLVDNDSSDGSQEVLLQQPDVQLWSSDFSFQRANFGSAWFEVLLRRLGLERWCLIVDADEYLKFAGCEQRSLGELCLDLEAAGKRAMAAVLLDVYSDRPIQDTQAGENPLEVCRYCDRQFFHERIEQAGPYANQTIYLGGVRQRVFGEVEFYLSKVPLVRYDTQVVLTGGQHFTNLPASDIASETGALLHLKYLESFPALAREQVRRGEHYRQAEQYRVYDRKLSASPLTLFDPALSVEWHDSRGLQELGAILAPPHSPPYLCLNDTPVRPGVQVALTVYRRLDYLAISLASVLAQEDADLEIEVVQDGEVGEEAASGCRRLVQELGQGRVALRQLEQRLGQPEIFNDCLRRSRREWVHLLHDDDRVESGFYQHLRAAAALQPEAAMVFCRHRYIDEHGQQLRLSPLEGETAGELRDWLERIAVFCRIQAPSVLVQRRAYVALGGYRTQAGSVFDWDMWKRVAAAFPVCYEPRVLACFRQHGASLSARYLENGRQLSDSARSIALTRALLGPELSQRATRAYARYGLDLVRRFLRQGKLEAAWANLQEVLRLDDSPETLQILREMKR